METVLFGVMAFAAFWTMTCNFIVFSGLSFHTLMELSPLPVLATAAALRLLRPQLIPTAAVLPSSPAPRRPAKAALPWLLAATAPVALLLATHSYPLFWALACGLLTVALWSHRTAPPLAVVPLSPMGRSERWTMAGLCLLVMAVNAVVQHVHADDYFYLGMAAGVLDSPDAPVFAEDTFYGLRGLPLTLPVYRVHSIELFGAAIAWLTGFSHIKVRNLGLSLAFAPFAVLSLAFLLRQLMPRRWIAPTVAATLMLVAMAVFSAGGVSLNWLWRIHQGKAFLGAVMVPLIMAFALRFAATGDPRYWACLALAQVAAVGATASGLFVAPVTAGLTLLAATGVDRRGLRRMLWGCLASTYPLGLGLLLRHEVHALAPIVTTAALPPLYDHILIAFAGPLRSAAALWCLLAAWALVEDASSRRTLIIVVLAFLTIFFNPWLIPLWAHHLTGVPTVGRLWWVLPFPVWFGLTMAAPFLLAATRLSRLVLASTGAAIVALSGAAVIAERRAPDGDAHYQTIAYGWPRPKVPWDLLATIRSIRTALPGRPVVLAPFSLSRWFVVDPGHAYPLVVTDNILEQIGAVMGENEVVERRQLLDYVDGASMPQGRGLLHRRTADGRLGAVVVPIGTATTDEIGAALAGLGWTNRRIDGYLVWAPALTVPSAGQE